MFLPPESLRFDLAALIEKSILDWHAHLPEPTAVPLPETEGAGDFIVSEMDHCSLRRVKGATTLLDADATAEQYRQCIFRALNTWLIEIQRERSSEEKDAYNLPWG